MGHAFGRDSKKKLETAEVDMQKVMNLAIRRSRVDFGVSHAHRTPEYQFELFKKGREEKDGKWVVVNPKEVVTNCDGYTNPSDHNMMPSKAVDIYIYVPGMSKWAYDEEHLSYVAGVIQTCADELLEKGEISHRVVWGGNWDDDGIILKDQNFWDRPHFQLRK